MAFKLLREAAKLDPLMFRRTNLLELIVRISVTIRDIAGFPKQPYLSCPASRAPSRKHASKLVETTLASTRREKRTHIRARRRDTYGRFDDAEVYANVLLARDARDGCAFLVLGEMLWHKDSGQATLTNWRGAGGPGLGPRARARGPSERGDREPGPKQIRTAEKT